MAAKRSRLTHAAALVAVTALMSAGVSGCGMGRALGISKSSPDEFAVVTKAPLVLPPDYELRPPKPGAKRPQELEPSEAAKQALLGNNSSNSAAAPTAGEQALLASMGSDKAEPATPKQGKADNQVLVRKSESFSNKLMFGNENAIPASAVSTAAKREEPQQAAMSNEESADEGTTEGKDEAASEAEDEATDEAAAESTDESADEGSEESADESTDDTGDEDTDDSGDGDQ